MTRYSIYDLIGENVSFKNKDKTITGICEDIKRDVLDNKIILKVDGNDYIFIEPHKIEENENEISLIYGSEQTEDLMNFCGEEYAIHWGEDLRKSIGREKNFLRITIKRNETANG